MEYVIKVERLAMKEAKNSRAVFTMCVALGTFRFSRKEGRSVCFSFSRKSRFFGRKSMSLKICVSDFAKVPHGKSGPGKIV